jgi:hypothetical protein
MDNLSEQMLDKKDFEVLDPKYANFGGPTPLLLEAETVGQELAAALHYAQSEASVVLRSFWNQDGCWHE